MVGGTGGWGGGGGEVATDNGLRPAVDGQRLNAGMPLDFCKNN